MNRMIDLKENREFVKSYIDLRNKYTTELNTKPITVESTNEWLDKSNGAIHCCIDGGNVISAVIVHPRQEVTVFSDRKGMGDRLIEESIIMAFSLGFKSLWAKIGEGNVASEKLFLRHGYEKVGDRYEKNLHYHSNYGMRKGAEKFPLMAVLSFVYKCNAGCPNCPYNNSDIRSKYKDNVFMNADVFTKIADECGPHGTVLRLTGGGDPFLNKNIFGFTRYAADKGCKVSIITNGSTDVSEVIDVADMIEFSVDVSNEKEYAYARPGLDWEFLNKNIRNAMKRRTKTKIICSVINQKNIDVDKAVKYWSFVDHVQVRRFLTWGINDDKSANNEPYLPQENNIPCPWLFERISIDSRGDITYCGFDIGFDYKFANIFDRSIEEIWNASEYKDIRDLHLSGKGIQFPLCSKCPDWQYRSWDFNYWRLRDYAGRNLTA